MEETFDQKILRLWQEAKSKPVRDLALSNGLRTRELKEYWQQIGLYGKELADPSPEVIRERARQIRNEWDEETRMNRWIGLRGDATGLL